MEQKQTTIPDDKIQFVREKMASARTEIQKQITGMQASVEAVLLAMVSQGHVLLEGMPGLAKTLLAKTISKSMDSPFQRIQFTPDLLPADLTGTSVFNPKTATFDIRKGPVFTGVLLADEINRAPAKVQSALLQCMEERLVSIGDQTFELDPNFFVIATQNPIDQEGTYQLPEAQMDRFILKIQVGYPSQEDEISILDQHGQGGHSSSEKVTVILKGKDRIAISRLADSVYIDPKLKEYIVRIVRQTRPETSFAKETSQFIRHGASPRASLSFLRIARAKAILEGRDFVIPEDIQAYAKEILRHRILLNYEALAEDVSVDNIIESILETIGVP
ncbi:AAA family ATPase [Leptospira sp. GIMC2001]|uniref:AAA family ATPase n=1 Tax=Leptospira sp. GIMC2001 TaxID=1513297 RepID=UPI00234AD64C|nr:MoxR family ATPase [Leptospira sp. GIMC2001]WCL47620.1 MoxR family ATPase [Leptospira sp. GIMC2001]